MVHQNIRLDQTYDRAHKRGKTLVAKTKADRDSQNLQIDQDYSKFKAQMNTPNAFDRKYGTVFIFNHALCKHIIA